MMAIILMEMAVVQLALLKLISHAFQITPMVFLVSLFVPNSKITNGRVSFSFIIYRNSLM